MKLLKLPSRVSIHAQSDVDLQQVFDLTNAARSNGIEVINASLAYEKYIEEIIEKYIFIERDHPNIGFFRNFILSADWLTFSAKRKIIIGIVQKEKYFTGNDISLFEQQLRRIMSYRNAFAHGDIVFREGNVYISYFEGIRQEKLLDDAYWDKLEEVYIDVWNLITDIREILGIEDDVQNIYAEQVDE